MPKRKNKNFRLPGKPILFLLLAAVCAMVIVHRFRLFLLRSSYFTITGVAIEGLEADEFKERPAPLETTALPEETKKFLTGLVGKNIFSQDLKALKKQIEEAADIECVVISRRLPGELVFKLRKRIPAAQLKLARYHLLDQAGMLIAGASDAAYDNLPVILGMEKKNSQGKPYQYHPGAPELTLALELIKEKNNTPALAHYRITKVYPVKDYRAISKDKDVSNGGYVLNQKTNSFFIVENFPDTGLFPEGDKLKKNTPLAQIEIKFDLQRPVDTMRVLGALLDKLQPQGSLQEGLSPLLGIEYIDLRNIDSPVVMEKKNKQ